MRNKNCLPNTLVPKQKRLAVYKQAVEHIKTKSSKESRRNEHAIKITKAIEFVLLID